MEIQIQISKKIRYKDGDSLLSLSTSKNYANKDEIKQAIKELKEIIHE